MKKPMVYSFVFSMMLGVSLVFSGHVSAGPVKPVKNMSQCKSVIRGLVHACTVCLHAGRGNTFIPNALPGHQCINSARQPFARHSATSRWHHVPAQTHGGLANSHRSHNRNTNSEGDTSVDQNDIPPPWNPAPCKFPDCTGGTPIKGDPWIEHGCVTSPSKDLTPAGCQESDYSG